MMTASNETMTTVTQGSAGSAVLLFDDQCAVCRRFVQFVKRLDRFGRLRFAPLQSLFGDTIRRTHEEFARSDSALLVREDGTILAYSDAILTTLELVGGQSRRFARLLHRIPQRVRDRAYTAVASRRNLLASLRAFSLSDLLFSINGTSRHQW